MGAKGQRRGGGGRRVLEMQYEAEGAIAPVRSYQRTGTPVPQTLPMAEDRKGGLCSGASLAQALHDVGQRLDTSDMIHSRGSEQKISQYRQRYETDLTEILSSETPLAAVQEAICQLKREKDIGGLIVLASWCTNEIAGGAGAQIRSTALRALASVESAALQDRATWQPGGVFGTTLLGVGPCGWVAYVCPYEDTRSEADILWDQVMRAPDKLFGDVLLIIE